MTSRTGTCRRKTRETDIDVAWDLDTESEDAVATDLPFLSHMLEALACHGRFGLTVNASGDVDVDPHHLIEDAGIVLGTAFSEAVSGGGPVERAGYFVFPMDGSLAQVAVDLCGRPNLVWNVPLGPGWVGRLDPRLFRDFFKGFADAARATIHVNVPYADGDHHAVEAAFKAFARALRRAVRPVGAQVLSTKGAIDA